jgi:hypothetical protein
MVVSFVGPETPTNLEFRPSIVKPESRTLFRLTLPALVRKPRPAAHRIGAAAATRSTLVLTMRLYALATAKRVYTR